MKTCIKCNKKKPIDKFGNHPTARDGKRNQCESCRYKQRASKPDHKTKQRNWNLMRYGLTIEDFNLLAKSQNNKCAICKTDSKLFVDHDHVTKKVRGLLCHHCNSMLGLVKDSPQILERAIHYLDLGR